MKKKIFILILLQIFYSKTFFPKTYTDKIFLTPRPQLSNMAIENTTWHRQISKKGNIKFDKHIQATSFYQSSNNKSNLGQYFGTFAEKEEKKGRDYISIVSSDQARIEIPGPDKDAIDSTFLLHDREGTRHDFAGKIRLRPNQNTYGIRFDYYQNFKNFFFKISSPFVRVENNIGAQSISTQYNFTDTPADPRSGKNLFDFFSGNLELITDVAPHNQNQQKALTHAKITGKKSARGFADVDLTLGYKILNKKENIIDVGINVIIPTGNTPKGEYLFEPIYGNNNHWGLGTLIDLKLRLSKNENESLDLLISGNLKYLFKNTEKRTPGIINDDGNKISFGHYILGGQRNEFALFPLANILTQDVRVEPGLQFEGLASLAFSLGNLTFDLGYNFFIKEGERVSLKNTWDNNKYAIANNMDFIPPFTLIAYRTSTAPQGTAPAQLSYYGPFDPTNPYHINPEDIDGPIQEKHLNLDAITSPIQITQKIYCGLGYIFNELKYPLMLGIGTSYEVVASGNSGLKNLTFWGKSGLSF